MSAVMVAEPDRAAGIVTDRSRRSGATFALARVETVRLLCHPVTLAATLLLCIYWGYGIVGGADRFPVLQNDDRGTQFACAFLLGGAALIGTDLAMLRARRYGVNAVIDVATMPALRRTCAHLVSVVALGAIAATLVAVRIVALASQPHAVGRVNVYELATGPLCVVLLGVAGIVLGRWNVPAVLAPLALVGLAVITVVPALPGVAQATGAQWRWLVPVVYEDHNQDPIPGYLLGRPAGAHALYLVAFIALLTVVAVAPRREKLLRTAGFWHRGWSTAVSMLAALALLTSTAAVELAVPSATLQADRSQATVAPVAHQICIRRAPAIYCAYPDFTPMIGPWSAVLHGVLANVPASATYPSLSIRQHVRTDGEPLPVVQTLPKAPVAAWQQQETAAGLSPENVMVGTSWSAEAEFGFAASVAYAVAGGPVPPTNIEVACGARGVLALWLATQATPRAAEGLRQLQASSSGGVTVLTGGFGAGLFFDSRQIDTVAHLERLSTSAASARVSEAWTSLMAPHASTDAAADLLRIPRSAAPAPIGMAPC